MTPDEWMIPLFGDPDAGGKRDVIEGRMISVALDALRAGADVVLDFGVWSRDERSALRALANEVGATCRLVYLPIERDEQLARLSKRPNDEGADRTSFNISASDLAEYAAIFEAPDDSELASAYVDPPPDGTRSWRQWAARRWPSFR